MSGWRLYVCGLSLVSALAQTINANQLAPGWTRVCSMILAANSAGFGLWLLRNREDE